ncbi:MAG TPA: hypothetical protein PKM57_05900 [Kiritimatiellia bacterium]|nr:hypothetical protein [Kiritimatiellia bacterium]HPS07202.1 hypothetical protein [Kiritimatiellia bacterium]
MWRLVHVLLLHICSVVMLRAADQVDPSLLLWLPFDEGRGALACDRSGNALEADLSNVQWAAGLFGTAVHFGGTNAFAELPAVPGLNGATQFTLSVWATWEDPAPRRYPNLLTSQTWSPGGLMLFVTDGACSFRLGRPGERSGAPGNKWTEIGAGLLGVVPQRQWTHLCVTFALPNLTTYVNGKPVGRAQWPYSVEADALRLGGWNGEVSHNGLLDDLRLYSRALSEAEVAGLAKAPGRARADYTLADGSSSAEPPAATFSNRRATLVIDPRGQAVSLRIKASGRELLARPQPVVSARLQDGRQLTARRVTAKGDALTFEFPRGFGTAVIGVGTHRDYFTFTVRSLTLANVQSLTFCVLPVTATKYHGAMANMLSDDADGVCLRGLDLPVEMTLRGNTVGVSTTATHGLIGCRAGLAAGPKAEMPTILRVMAEDAGVPYSKVGGPWSLGAEENRGSYLFADLAHASTEDWIEIARRGGFSTLHLHGWWRTLGHYEVNTNLYPRGLADMKDTVDRIHVAGLRAGIHTLTACIDPRDPWITPEASPHLIPFDTYTLARDVSPTDTVLYVNELPSSRHDVVFTYMGNGNAIRIGSEIVQYAEVAREPPYAFGKCARGAFKTRSAAHAAGERADYLQQRYISFYPQPDSPLADELAGRVADVFNTCRLDQLYFDGSEGMMSRYGIDAMRHKIFKRLKDDPLIEASCHGAHNWWFHSRLGAWDHPVWAAKRFHDKHIATSAQYRKTDLIEPQMGWWAPRIPSPQARGHFLDEMEYFACKNLGLDAAMSIQGVNVSHGPLPFHIEKQFTLLGWYEHLRLARYFDAQTVARVAVPGEEFRLRQNRDGLWQFTPVTMTAHRISSLGNGSEAWTVCNAREEQPLSARIEALYAVAPYDSPQRKMLVGTDDFVAFQTSSAAAAVTLRVAEETADTRGGARNLRLLAENRGGSSTGAWARAVLTFPAPYRNLGGTGAFGVWVKGDGSGALLNLQLGTPREFMHALSDHYVTLDFKGWRYVELLVRERDVERMDDYVWPYGGAYDVYRNTLDMTHVSQVSLYVNDLPAGGKCDVTVSPVMALPSRPALLREPVLTVNGRTLALPFTLSSGDFAELEPDGVCTHYSEKGDPLARFICGAGGPPALRAGPNTLLFSCVPPSNVSARAEVTVSAFGAPFGTARPRRATGRKHLEREYEMPRLVLASNDISQATWEVAVRPGEKAALEIELCGTMTAPVLTVGGHAVGFPVSLKDGQRLICHDCRSWTVFDAKRAILAQGKLDVKVPMLASGPNQIVFACTTSGRSVVKLTKVYD